MRNRNRPSPTQVVVLENIEPAIKESLAAEKAFTCEEVGQCQHGHLQGIAKLSQPGGFFIAGTPESDSAVGINLFATNLTGQIFQNYNSSGNRSKKEHTDGIQAVGQYVFVSADPVLVFRIQELSLKQSLKPAAVVDLKEHLPDVGGVAVAKISAGSFQGKYAMAVGFQELTKIGLYISDITDPDQAGADWGFNLIKLNLGRFEKNYTWSIRNRANYQSISFVTECQTNRLFLIGLGRAGDGNRENFFRGENIADLFLVGTLEQSRGGAPVVPPLTFLSSKKFKPIRSDFAGAAGASVNPEGQLEIYSITKARLPPSAPLQIEIFSKK